MKRFVVFSDEGIHGGPRADIVIETDEEYRRHREEFNSLKIGEAKITENSGCTFYQVITRVTDFEPTLYIIDGDVIPSKENVIIEASNIGEAYRRARKLYPYAVITAVKETESYA